MTPMLLGMNYNGKLYDWWPVVQAQQPLVLHTGYTVGNRLLE